MIMGLGVSLREFNPCFAISSLCGARQTFCYLVFLFG